MSSRLAGTDDPYDGRRMDAHWVTEEAEICKHQVIFDESDKLWLRN